MSFADTLLELAPAALHEVEVLVSLIAMSDDQHAAALKAQKMVLADLADAGAGAGAAAEAILAHGMKP